MMLLNHNQEVQKVVDVAGAEASAALESLRQCRRSSEASTSSEQPHRHRPMIKFPSQKRSYSQIGTFDMSGMEEASKTVESSIAFPTIEWPAFEGDDDDTDSDEPECLRQPAKRPRLGLVRSAPSFNLVALASSERFDTEKDLC